jgi:hypothetical protein
LLRAVVLRDEPVFDAVLRRDVLPEPVLRDVERLLAALRVVDRLLDVVLRLRLVVVFFSAMWLALSRL